MSSTKLYEMRREGDACCSDPADAKGDATDLADAFAVAHAVTAMAVVRQISYFNGVISMSLFRYKHVPCSLPTPGVACFQAVCDDQWRCRIWEVEFGEA